MIYGDKLKHALKNEKNPINKMYLNELLINWKKVETSLEDTTDSPISTLVSAITTYTKFLSTNKFIYNDQKKCGFHDDHDVFKAHYLFDMLDRILADVGIKDTQRGLIVRNRAFNTGFVLEQGTFPVQSQKAKLDFQSSNKCYYVGLEFDMQFRLANRKFFNKGKIFIPLIIFYIEKCYNEDSFNEINQLKKDMVCLNPHALLFCLTETVDKKFIHLYSGIEDCLYVLRACFKNDPYKDLQPQVFLSFYNKLLNYVKKEVFSFENIVPFGHVDLVNRELAITVEEEE